MSKEAIAFMMVSIIPEDAIVEKLESAVKEYALIKNKKNKENLYSACTAMLLKFQVGDDMKEALDLGTTFEEMQRREDIFNPGKG